MAPFRVLAQAYTRNGYLYTHLGTPCPKCLHQKLLLSAHAHMHLSWNETGYVHHYPLVYTISPFQYKAYMLGQATMGFGVRKWGWKYLNWVYALFWCKSVLPCSVKNWGSGFPIIHDMLSLFSITVSYMLSHASDPGPPRAWARQLQVEAVVVFSLIHLGSSGWSQQYVEH